MARNGILTPVNSHKKLAYGLLCLATPILISGCERETYTTWSCINSAGEKTSMILKKAQMQFQDRQFDYCGSLGPVSYFDQRCPANIENSSKVFIPSSGKLTSDNHEFQCNAL